LINERIRGISKDFSNYIIVVMTGAVIAFVSRLLIEIPVITNNWHQGRRIAQCRGIRSALILFIVGAISVSVRVVPIAELVYTVLFLFLFSI